MSKELGLSAIAVVAPIYYKAATADSLAEFVARIGESVPESRFTSTTYLH